MTIKKNITGIITWLVAIVSGLVVILFPLGFYFHAYQNTVGMLEAEAEINADVFTHVVSSNPEFWEFEHIRLTEYLVHRPKEGVAELRRIVNTKNEIVSEGVDDLQPPLIMRSSEIMDSGIMVGRVEIYRSLRPLLKQTGLVFLLVLPLGLGVFYVLRIVPIRTILLAETALLKTNCDLETTNKLLQEEIVKCQRVEAELCTLNEELEARVVERTLQLEETNRNLETQIAERAQAEKALIESEKRYRLLIEDSSDLIYTVSFRGHFIYVNPVAERIMGWPLSEIVGKHYLSFVRPDFHEEIIAFYKKQYDEHIPSTYLEYPIITENGRTRWIGQNVQFRSVNEKVTGFQAVARDITDRKKAEEELIDSEKKYRLLTEKMTDIVWILDMNLRTVYVSPSIEPVLGFIPEERMAQDVHEQLTPASMSVALDVITKELALEQQGQADPERSVTLEMELYHKDGSTRWIESIISGIRDDRGVLTAFHGVSRNITDRRKAEGALRESEKKYRELVDFLPISLLEIDLQGNIISANPAILETFGYTQSDLEKGLNAFNQIVPDDLDRLGRHVQKLLSEREQITSEYTGIRKDGSTFPVMIFSSVVIREGKPVGMRGAIIDLTSQNRAERDLQNARDQLLQSEKLSSMGRLSAGVAHEILNPVNIISLELQILQTMETLPPEVIEELKICMAQVIRIVTIAENLKQFSRIPAKEMIMADINDVISHILTLYSTQLKIDGVETEVQYQSDLPEIIMEREKIEQVLMNLISNATASMAGKEKKVLRITTRRNVLTGDHDPLTIVVADTGAGIRKEDMPKIFDPFFTTKGQGKGTGLGLSISYGIIHDHGGRIWAENNEWGGASFLIELPVETGE